MYLQFLGNLIQVLKNLIKQIFDFLKNNLNVKGFIDSDEILHILSRLIKKM